MTNPLLDMPTPVFSREDSPTVSFLRAEAAGGKPWRFPARNFLLDEGVVSERADSYHRWAGIDFVDGDDWTRGHGEYLSQKVYLEQTRGVPKKLDPARRDRCPETFCHEVAFRAFGSAYRKLRMVRVVKADFVARLAGAKLDHLLSWSRDLLTARSEGQEPDAGVVARVEDVLALWGERCDLRPVWASFLEDHTDLLGAKPGDDVDSWADDLRDRLGLSHVDPPAAGSVPILVFVYPVSAVPDRRSFKGKPLAVPTVLDGDLSIAFCPAPDAEPVGRVVNLAGTDRPPAREVVHPLFVPTAEHLFRVGEVTRRVPADLSSARARHLHHLRGRRPDYGDVTDADILGVAP